MQSLAIRRASGTSAAPATRVSRDLPRILASTRGATIRFKIRTNATNYRLDIYRLGYYNGLGARLVATVSPSAALPQNQPNPITNSSTGLIDCGNWAESASWAVPADATSGVYIAKVVRTDTGGASHIAFVVRDDSSTSDLSSRRQIRPGRLTTAGVAIVFTSVLQPDAPTRSATIGHLTRAMARPLTTGCSALSIL